MTNNCASFFVALTLGILYGQCLNVTNPVISEEPWVKLGPWLIALISVSLAIGATIGSFFGGFISDRIGPKKTLAGGMVLCVVCVVWIWTQTENLALLLILRIVNGLGIGIATSTGPQYIGEQAAAKQRGMFGTMFQLFICTGQLIAIAMGVALYGVKNAWRYHFLSTGIFAVVFLAGVFCLPESAGYVATQNRKAQARLSGSSGINADVEQQGGDQDSEPSLLDDVTSVFKAAVTSKRAFLTGLMLAIFQQVTGINIFMLYSNSIFNEVGWGGKNANIASVIMLAWNLISVIVAIFLVDNLGRKPLLITGFGLMMIGTVLIAILGWLKNKTIAIMIAFSVPSVAIYLLGFQMGPGPMYFVTVSELYDAAIRGRAMGLINGINWLSNILVSLVFPQLFLVMHMVTFIIFAILSLIILVFVIVYVREMKGTTLQGQEGDGSETQPLKSDSQDGYSSD